jgi:hypothetical protein
MSEAELGRIDMPLEYVYGTPRNPKNYLSRRIHMIAFLHSMVDRMSLSQLLELRIPSRFCV